MKKLLVLFIGAVLLTGFWWVHAMSPIDGSDKKTQAVTIESGSSITTIANQLEEKGLIRSPFAFKLYARLTGVSTKLQAGTFSMSPSLSVAEIIGIVKDGRTEEFRVTIPEGLTVADLDELLASKGLGQPGDIIDCAFTCDFATFDFLPARAAATKEEGIGSRLEGYLFPETYSVSLGGYVPKFFLEQMLGTFQKRIINAYESDMKKSGRTLAEIVTMASLIEEESRHDDERAVVSGILWKRLDNSVVLGVDATTRYELQKRTETLTKDDMETVSPYNTRRTQGLPPSPIASAGESSFVAALRPTASQYWYYLHGNDALIHYAITNDEHNVNRAKYLR